jgi:hypothetical protein
MYITTCIKSAKTFAITSDASQLGWSHGQIFFICVTPNSSNSFFRLWLRVSFYLEIFICAKSTNGLC